jgi:cytochrome c553
MMNRWGPGRSPSYIVRQLLAFKTGVRNDPAAQPMREVTAQLSEAEMVDVAAWFGSLEP